MESYCKKTSQAIDINLYYLGESLKDLKGHTYCSDVEKKIDELINYIEEKLYNKIYYDYDILKEEFILNMYFEKPNFRTKRSDNCQ